MWLHAEGRGRVIDQRESWQATGVFKYSLCAEHTQKKKNESKNQDKKDTHTQCMYVQQKRELERDSLVSSFHRLPFPVCVCVVLMHSALFVFFFFFFLPSAVVAAVVSSGVFSSSSFLLLHMRQMQSTTGEIRAVCSRRSLTWPFNNKSFSFGREAVGRATGLFHSLSPLFLFLFLP